MADPGFDYAQVNDLSTQKLLEITMMRFIFALPVGDVSLLSKENQFCVLCHEPYNEFWNIKGWETAVVLPCGHFVGSNCIRKWLSPFEDGRTKCPFPDCGLGFPCAVNGMHRYEQCILRGKLRPTVRAESSDTGAVIDGDALTSRRGSDGDDEGGDSEEDSVLTQELMSELAVDFSVGDIEPEDPSHDIANVVASSNIGEECPEGENVKIEVAEIPSSSCGEEHEDVSIIGSEECSHVEGSEGEASNFKSMGLRAMVRGAMWRVTRANVQGRKRKWSY